MDITEFEQQTHALTVTGNASDSSDINVEHFGFENTLPDKPSVSSAGYPAFRLHYIIGGSLTLYTGGKRVQLRKGNCFLLRPDSDIEYRTNPNHPASFYWVSVNGQRCRSCFAEMGFGKENYLPAIPKEYRRELRRIFYANFVIEEPLKEIIDSVFLANFLRIYHLLYLVAHKDSAPKRITGKRKEYGTGHDFRQRNRLCGRVFRSAVLFQGVQALQRHFAERASAKAAPRVSQ